MPRNCNQLWAEPQAGFTEGGVCRVAIPQPLDSSSADNDAAELDDELLGWLREAYEFAHFKSLK